MIPFGWVYDPQFLDHDTGPFHLESPARLASILTAVRDAGLLQRLIPLPARAATAEELARVHEPAYIELVRVACAAGLGFLGSEETRICPRSYDVACLAAGGVLAAVEAVWRGEVRRAFCAVRPPGHHAQRDRAAGFCLFNHVAVAAEHLICCHGLQRVAVVDFDVHHGDGTQQLFNDRDDVLLVSVHECPGSLPFPGSGSSDEVGTGRGTGYTMNLPLDRGTREADYLAAWTRVVLPALDRFRPQFLLLSAGFDALAWDTVSSLSLTPASFGRLTTPLVELAEHHAEGRLVSVLEGGYDLTELGAAVVAHLRALGG